MSRASIGFTHQDHSADGSEAIKKTFTPEFRNRLDAVIQFKPLDEDTIVHVVDKFMVELEALLEQKRVMVDVEDEALRWLARHGYDATMGARPMARLIQNKIKKPLAEQVLFGDLANGGRVTIGIEDGELSFTYEARDAEKVKEKA